MPTIILKRFPPGNSQILKFEADNKRFQSRLEWLKLVGRKWILRTTRVRNWGTNWLYWWHNWSSWKKL